MKHDCYSCKHYKVYITQYCSKQESIIYHPNLECKYWDRGFLGKLADKLFPSFPEEEKSENCKKGE